MRDRGDSKKCQHYATVTGCMILPFLSSFPASNCSFLLSGFIMYKCIGGQIILEDDEPYAAHLKSKALEREVKKEQVEGYLNDTGKISFATVSIVGSKIMRRITSIYIGNIWDANDFCNDLIVSYLEEVDNVGTDNGI